jgi:hypothetical protein
VLFPQALIFGMSYEQFWDDDPQIFWMYSDAYNKRKEIEFKEQNYMMWLNGQYTLMAMAQVMANMLSKSKKEIYPKMPLGEVEKNKPSMRERFEVIASKVNEGLKNKKEMKE